MATTDLPDILARIVEKDESLTSVILSDCKVQPGQMELLFGEHSLLKELCFENVQIPDYVCETIAKHLQNNRQLKTLRFRYSGFQTQGAVQLAKCLKNPECRLEELEIVGCSILAAGAEAFADSLKDKNCKLTELTLNEASVGDDGSAALFLSLIDNDRLKKLCLDWNMISSDSGASVCTALSSNRTLEDLSLAYNNIPVKYLADALSQNKTLRRLNLLGNKIGDAGAIALRTGLENNTSLRAINLYLCGIGEEGINSLLRALEVNSTLETVTIKSNAIAAMLYKNSQISNIVEKRLQAQLKLLFEVVGGGLHSTVDVDADFWEAVKAACEDEKRPISDAGNPSCLLRALDAGATAAAHLIIKANIFSAVEAAASVKNDIQSSSQKYESLVSDIQGSLKALGDALQNCVAPSEGSSGHSYAIAEGRAALKEVQHSIEAVINSKIEKAREEAKRSGGDDDDGDNNNDDDDNDDDDDEDSEIEAYPEEIKEAVAHLVEQRTKILETEIEKSKARLKDAQGKSDALEAQRTQYLDIQKEAMRILSELDKVSAAEELNDESEEDVTPTDELTAEFALLAPSSSDVVPRFESKFAMLQASFEGQASRALSALKGTDADNLPEATSKDLAPLVVDVLEFGSEAATYVDGRLSRAAKKYRSRCQAILDEAQGHLRHLSAVDTEQNARNERLWCDFLEKHLAPETFEEVEDALNEALEMMSELNDDLLSVELQGVQFDFSGQKKTKAAAQKMKQRMDQTKTDMQNKRHKLRAATARAHSGIATMFPELKYQDALHLTGKHSADFPSRNIVEYSNIEAMDESLPNVQKAIITELEGHNRTVVLKKFDLSTALGVTGFNNELKLRKEVQHRNLLPCTAIAEDQKKVAYVEMPYCSQGNLEDWLEKKPSDSEKFKVALQVVLAIDALHSKKYLHRDLSLRNCLVDHHNHVYVGDFDVSVPADMKTVKFQPHSKYYCAPELLKKGGTASLASDIYSLGCVLFDIFFGFDQRSDSDAEWKIPYHKNKHLRPLLASLLNTSAHARPPIDAVRAHPFFAPNLDDSTAIDAPTLEALVGPADAGWKYQGELSWQTSDEVEESAFGPFQHFDVTPGSNAFHHVSELVEGVGGPHNRLNEQNSTLMKATLVRNSAHEAAFFATMGNLASRYNENSPFVVNPNWSQGDAGNIAVMDYFFKTGGYNQIPVPHGIKGLHIMTVFHGTDSLERAQQICRSGFAVVSKTPRNEDKGWYGQGLYFTLDLKNALRYYGEAVVVCNVVFGNPFPVTRLRNGAPLERNHDSHIVVVDGEGYPAKTKSSERFTELVLGEAAQIVPRAILQFGH